MIENLVGKIDCAEINDNNKEVYKKLIEFENTINPYLLNPGFPGTSEKVKEAYMKYLSVKKNSIVPDSWEEIANELVESAGGILK